jgi:hypothetical protein
VFLVESVHGGTRLEFSGSVPRAAGPYEGYAVEVRLSGGGVSAGDLVHDHLAYRWAEFFQSMAVDWRGWEGERVIESLEYQLKLTCTADGRGHVALRVELRGDPLSSNWRAAETLHLEAGQLDDLARRAKEYFGGEASRDA